MSWIGKPRTCRIPFGETADWQSALQASLNPYRWQGQDASFPYCLSYSPLLTRLSTVKPAFFASEIESLLGELKEERTLRTGFLQAGHWLKGAAESGRRKTNLPPQTLQSPSQSSYSYNGML